MRPCSKRRVHTSLGKPKWACDHRAGDRSPRHLPQPSSSPQTHHATTISPVHGLFNASEPQPERPQLARARGGGGVTFLSARSDSVQCDHGKRQNGDSSTNSTSALSSRRSSRSAVSITPLEFNNGVHQHSVRNAGLLCEWLEGSVVSSTSGLPARHAICPLARLTGLRLSPSW
jgi:hypothetical protein